MKTGMLLGLALLSAIIATMCGCAGTAKGGASPSAMPAASTMVLAMSTQGNLPPGSSIGGIDVTLHLPSGVTVKADKTSETLPGVVVASGVAQGAPLVAKFTPAAAGAPGQVRIALLKLSGFGTGEFATLRLDVGGPSPLVTNFGTAKTTITDINGTIINGLTITTTLQR